MKKTIHRIIEMLDALNLSARKFDISIGAANGYTLRMKKNNASVGSDVITRILDKYPQIDLVWLMTGKGEMFVSEAKQKSDFEIEQYINDRLQKEVSKEKKEVLDEILSEIQNIKSKN